MLKINIKSVILKSTANTDILLRDINFELPPNKIFTVIGRNGAGKTTLLKCISNLLDENEYKIDGEIIYKGRNLLKLSEKVLIEIRKEKIKVVFQDAHKSFDQLKTFKYYFDFYKGNNGMLEELLSYFQLPPKEEIEKMHPYEVSGGMAQRIALIIALFAKPEIIFLDEPTASVDTGIANLIKLKLEEIVKEFNCSVILITQDLDFAQAVSDKIALLYNSGLSQFMKLEDFFDKQSNHLLLSNL